MVTIKLFAMLKDKAGCAELALPFSGGTVAGLLQALGERYPDLREILACSRIMVSVNQELAANNATVKDGDEVALMPPFSGGSAGAVRIQQEPFSIEQEVAAIKQASSSIGAVVTFLGTTRDFSKGKEVSRLEFEHYPGMAEKKLAEIRDQAMREYGAIAVTIVHRVGVLPVGEEIVLIVAAAGHREEAFRACRFCIDELKRITPIWKKETTPDSETWVENHP